MLQKILLEVSDKYRFPIDYLAAGGTISAASTAIGMKFRLRLKAGWVEKCNLYTVILGQPGDAKSHALKFCFEAILKKDRERYNIYKEEMKQYENNRNTNVNDHIKKPILRKSLVSDYTPEALVMMLMQNPEGLCIFVDELLGWLKNFNRYHNSGGEAESYLTLWSGGGDITSDRATSNSIRVNDPFLNVIGSTQIGVLKELTKDGRDSNGFMDRLLFVYPNNPKIIKWNIEEADHQLLSNYTTIIERLLDLENERSVLDLDTVAKTFLFSWQNNRPDNFLFDYERSIEIKHQQYSARFALIIQLLRYACNDCGIEKVDLKSVRSGIKLMKYFRKNAIKVREHTTIGNYLESLSELQKTIYRELPNTFRTGDALLIACRPDRNNKARVSERQFKTYLKNKKLFKKLSQGGKYEKVIKL